MGGSGVVTSPPRRSRRIAEALAVPVTPDQNMTSQYSTPSPTKRLKRTPPAPKKIARTASFAPVVDTVMAASDSVEPHTLILGTHPSTKSLEQQRYYGHSQNAFWWIAGDCLGFRRDLGVAVNGEPFKFARHLRYNEDMVIPYESQVRHLSSRGFVLWDIVKSCERKGSLDRDIKDAECNDIIGLCDKFPSIKRIVISNGQQACTLLQKEFAEHFESGRLVPGDDARSQKHFSVRQTGSSPIDPEHSISVIVPLPVSPAAAKFSYVDKRESWERLVYSYQPPVSIPKVRRKLFP